MNVLSLFDGMSCGRIALDRLGIPVDKYYAAEIDKYAIQVSEANYPDIIRLGDVCDVKAEDLAPIDLLIAGSPCQGFSFAGKQLAFDDPRSALFFEFVRLLKECKPKYFLLENVRMKKEFLDVISEQVGCEPIFINSALVSAQNRQRFYWTNIPGIEQPEQRGIVLRDILETGTDENPVKNTERNKRHHRNLEDKSLCMTATMYKGAGNNGMTLVPETINNPSEFDKNLDKMTNKDGKAYCVTARYTAAEPKNSMQRKQRTMVPVISETHDTPIQVGTAVETISNKKNKSYALTASYSAARPRRSKAKHEKTMVKVNDTNNLPSGTDYIYDQNDKSHKITDGNREPKVIIAGAYRARSIDKDGNRVAWKEAKPQQMLELRKDNKSNSVTSVQKDSVLTKDEVYWRKLTPLECERLQTVPDNYTNHVSNSQRFKMLGNGWTIAVIKHIFKNMEIR